jgi:extracellular factor (EF) 3-hydroxypalmitic acid methyl ester biosynthesis protein
VPDTRTHRGAHTASELSGDESLLSIARSVAEDFVAEIERAARLTGGWQDDAHSLELVTTAAGKCLVRLAATGCWGEANRVPSSELWRIAGPVLEVGALQLHARMKPRGYAGDFEMLEKICGEICCEHPLGRVFDRFFLSQHAPQAVRNRTRLVARSIVEQCRRRGAAGCRVVSVGSGPAIDVRWALDELAPDQRRHVHVTLLDLDPAALDHAESSLAKYLPPGQMQCVRENLFRLPKLRRAAAALEDADLLICTGLFDYLNDDDATAMLATFWRSLAPQGSLLIFNFAPDNPSRAYMEWIGNWYLIYRDRQQMQQLAEQAGLLPNQFTIDAEPLGVNLFVRAERT